MVWIGGFGTLGEGEEIPCLRNNDVIERLSFAAKPREAYAYYHLFWNVGSVVVLRGALVDWFDGGCSRLFRRGGCQARKL